MKMFAQKKMIVLWFAALALLLAVSACTDYADEFKDEYEELFALGSSDDSNNESSSSEKGMSSSSIGSGKYETFVDERDSNVYKIVSIGKQKWFAENLRFDSDTSSKVGTNFCAEGDADCSIYGRFYGSKKVNEGAEYCPDGWHTPSLDEWVVLKATKRDIEDYLSVEDGGNNSTGFNALLAGHWSSKASYNRDSVAEFIYRTEISDSSYVVWLSDSEYFSTKQSNASWYAPIRCLSDEYSGVRASSYSVSECDGTTLYDASKDASEQGLEWVFWSCGDSCDSTYSDVGMAAFIGSPDENSDVSNWGGVCVEFESNGTALLWVKKTGDESTFVGLNTPLVATNGVEKRAFPWASFDGLDQKEPYKEGVVEVSYKNFDEPKHVKFVIKKITTLNKNVNLPSRSSDSAPVESSSSVEDSDAPSVFLWRGDQDDGSVVWTADEDEFFVRFPVPMDSFAGTMSERMKALIDTCKGVCGKMLEKIGSNSNPYYVKNFSAEIDISNSKGQWKGLCAIVEGDSVTVTVNATRANYMTAKGEYADTSLNVLFSDSLLKSLGSKLTVYFMKKGTGYFNIRALGNYDECKNLNLKNNGIPQDSIIYPLGKTAWKYLNPEVEYGMLTDSRDGNRYKTVSLYNKVWMAENLNYSVESNQKCGGPDGLAGNGCNIYGSLYGKESLENACPSGWHVATDGDWNEIVDYMGGVNDATPKLMSKYEKYDKSKLGTNESGLSVVNAGYFDANNGAISSVGKYGDFWRVGEHDGSFSYTGFGLSYVYVSKSDRVGDNEYSVRCVRDEADEKSPWSFLNAAIEYKTMTDDRDGHVYKTIDIGTQTWFAENLGYDTLEATVCRRDSCDLYGRMYLASKVQTDKVNFCPAGWRIPTVEDWNVLKKFVNDQGLSGSDLVSQKYGGKNSLGFSATVFGRFTNNTYVNSNYAEYMSTTGYFHINESVLSHGSGDKQENQYYRSIRCLRDAVVEEPSCKEKYASWCNLNSEKNYETFVDERDSREYKVIEIEDLEGLKWFAENLAYKPSGDTLTYCGNNILGCDTYGRLYSNSEVNQGSSFCPDGWRIPSDDEMDRLINLVSERDLVSQKENGGSNASGFSAVYAKRYTSSGYFNDQAEFLVDDGDAYRINAESSSRKVSYSNTTRFHSIRCVQGTLVNSSSSEDPESSSSIAESSSSVAE